MHAHGTWTAALIRGPVGRETVSRCFLERPWPARCEGSDRPRPRPKPAAMPGTVSAPLRPRGSARALAPASRSWRRGHEYTSVRPWGSVRFSGMAAATSSAICLPTRTRSGGSLPPGCGWPSEVTAWIAWRPLGETRAMPFPSVAWCSSRMPSRTVSIGRVMPCCRVDPWNPGGRGAG